MCVNWLCVLTVFYYATGGCARGKGEGEPSCPLIPPRPRNVRFATRLHIFFFLSLYIFLDLSPMLMMFLVGVVVSLLFSLVGCGYRSCARVVVLEGPLEIGL